MRIIILAAFIICVSTRLRAQNTKSGSPSQKDLQETGRVLKQAQTNAKTESARQTADRAADKGRLDQLAAEAKEKLSKSSAASNNSLIYTADQKLSPALRSATPEGRAIISQSAATPAMRAPDPEKPKENAPSKASSAAGATDGKNDKSGKDTDTPPSDINIRSEGAVYLDSNQALAIFTDDVVLDHPTFHMTSDKLEVYFVKESAKKTGPESKTPDSKVAASVKAQPVDAPAPQSGDAKLKHAIATGRKVVVRKLDENGEPQIGICRHLTYIGESGDVILRERPQVQRGNNVIVARENSTYMVMKQNGELKVHGPADTRIQQKLDTGSKPSAPASAPSGAVSVVPTLTPKKTAKK